MSRSFRRYVNRALGPLGYELNRRMPDVILHGYASYEDYRKTQIFHNKRKIDKIWADEATLRRVADRVRQEFPDETRLQALCHGTRNGYEQNFLATLLPVDILGTDISETAADFDRSVQWDFHDRNPEWSGRQHFVYSNSLDQSWRPREAVAAWVDQLRPGGLLILEHSGSQSPRAAGEMDPFGAKPEIMPYLLADWFGHQVALEISTGIKANGKEERNWLLILKRLSDRPVTVRESERFGH
jgi:hypothetical protein